MSYYNNSMVGYNPNFVTPPNSGVPIRFSQRNAPMKKTRFSNGYSAVGTMTKLRRKRVGMHKSFKQRVLSIPPAKHLIGNDRRAIGSDTLYGVNVTAQVTQGDTIGQRDGDAIYNEALKIKGHYESDIVSNAYKCRVLVGYSGEEYTSSIFSAATLTGSEVFFTNANNYNAIVNPKAFTVLYDTTMDLNSQIEGDATIQSFETTIQLKQMFNYQSSASVYGKTKNLYILVVPYGVGIAQGTGVGTISMSWDLIFKNF